jgi:phytoene desaturase|tara:strand:+ start:454 stop:1941 length:1488 start_codon:yes stop_codon:yes gene_type:complete
VSKIIVIGAGFGGLATAVRLACKGHQITLLEKREKLGGRAYVYEMDGFRFDGGPTIITAPWMFDELFLMAGKRREDYVEFVKCDPFYRIFDSNGQSFDYNDREEFILSEIDRFRPSDKRGYQRFVESARAIFNKGFVELADKPFLTLGDMLRVAPDLIRLRSYLSVYKYVSQFIKHDFLRQVFSFHPLLVGGNPFDTTSIYAMIHYLEREWGVWYSMGGTGALVDALAKLLEELGVNIRLQSEVKDIIVDSSSRKAKGVKLTDDTMISADAVVCNADVGNTYLQMIKSNHRRKYTDRRVKRMRYSMSLFVIYFGTKQRYAEHGLKHHNIILGPRYEGLLKDIFHNKGKLARDFSLYLHMPTYTDPSLAPAGHESFYVLSPVPNLKSGINWHEAAGPYRNAIMSFLEDNYLPGLQENLVVEHTIDPLHFEDTLNSYQGSAFSIEPILTQSAWFRPHNRSEELDNLYLVGAGTHPGAGLPGVLSSAKIASDLIGPMS